MTLPIEAPSHAHGETTQDTLATITLHLQVTDPEVLIELHAHDLEGDRQRYALTALRIGVLSLRNAKGQLDARAITAAGDKLLQEIRELLTTRSAEITYNIAGSLAQYLDPATGALPQRLEQLTRKGGDLERVLNQHLGTDDSVLARVLTKHLGEQSPVFQLLSPTDGHGICVALEQTVTDALAEQRRAIVREFSLDNKESALTRLIETIQAANRQLTADLAAETAHVKGEFSLDNPSSALSRLVAKVETTQRVIADQFSRDNEASAMNKISQLLVDTSAVIDKNLTLDDEQSSLARLKRELQGTIEGLLQKNNEFYTEMRETLARLDARREEAARSTRHGGTFEEQLGSMLAAEANKLADIYHPTGHTTGSIKNCKIGDYVIELGPDSAAPGVAIVWEAKADHSYTLKDVLVELDMARKNRQAQIGIFVFSQSAAAPGLSSFERYGNDIVTVWDPQDPASNVLIKAAYSVGRALAVRRKEVTANTENAAAQIDLAVRAIEKHLKQLEEIATWASTARNGAEKIFDRAKSMRDDLHSEVRRLDENLTALRLESAAA